MTISKIAPKQEVEVVSIKSNSEFNLMPKGFRNGFVVYGREDMINETLVINSLSIEIKASVVETGLCMFDVKVEPVVKIDGAIRYEVCGGIDYLYEDLAEYSIINELGAFNSSYLKFEICMVEKEIRIFNFKN